MSPFVMILMMFGVPITIFSLIACIGLLIQYPKEGFTVIKRIVAGIISVTCGAFVVCSPMIAAYLIEEDFIQWGWMQNDYGNWINVPFFLSWIALVLISAFTSVVCGVVAWDGYFGSK